jgi:hypothetical protein
MKTNEFSELLANAKSFAAPALDGVPSSGIVNFVPRHIALGPVPQEASFAVVVKPPQKPPPDPDALPYVGNWSYAFGGTGQTPAQPNADGSSKPAPELHITGTFTILPDLSVLTADNQHPSDNRPGQTHGWNPFTDFQVLIDSDTGSVAIQLLGHWHAGTGQVQGAMSPIGPYFDGNSNAERTRFTLNAMAASGMALVGEAVRQSD